VKATSEIAASATQLRKIDIYGYGVAAGEAAGAGEPKLKFTFGAFSAPGCGGEIRTRRDPNMPAIKFVGKLRTCVL